VWFTCVVRPPMAQPETGIVETALQRRAELITFQARSVSVGVAAIALFLLWDLPTTRRLPALGVGLGYLAFWGASSLWVRHWPQRRRLVRVLQDVADALAVGLGAALSGGLASPIWLLLYPHVVGVSVRGSLRYAMSLGALDALLVYWLALLSPSHALGELNAPAMLFCAFMGGSTSSFLRSTRARLAEANRALQAKNEELAATVEQVREANDRLKDLHRLRDEYLRNVSHEFRSPLTVIHGYAEFVRDQGVPSDSSLPDVMRVMLDSCDQMIDMVDTLLEVSRIEQGETRQRLDIRAVSMDQVLETALASVRGLADKKDARIDLLLPAEPLEVAGDLSLLAHAFRHLLSNALKYGPAKGTVSIRGRAHEGLAVLQVEDQGIGIPAEHLPHIFEKFYVADGGLDRRRGGAGVGLYLAREIVRLHEGTIEVSSQPGRGSVFSVALPRPKPVPPAEATL
jgi:signal transduction histidine kinase